VAVPIEAQRALNIVKSCFGDTLCGLYLHGSAVAGSLRPQSDVDLLVVLDRAMTRTDRENLLAALMEVSGRYPVEPGGPHPLEVAVFLRSDLAELAYPARSEFVYGEWLRKAFEAGEVPEPGSNPDFTLLLAQVRRRATALAGPDAANLLPIVPAADISRAIGDCLPALLDALEGDERNVLLTLARMWQTLATGEFVPKDVAAEWAIPQLPVTAAMLLASARDAYLGIGKDDWQAGKRETERAAHALSERIAARTTRSPAV
jgi:streptomycin 3"-adenylyltransferase